MTTPQCTASTWGWRAVNLIMAVFFSLAAFVNINDDDWYAWVPIYAVPALLGASSAMWPSLTENKTWQTFISLDFALCLLYGLYHMASLLNAWPEHLENPLIHEEGREMGGLLIILTWTGITHFSIGRNKNDGSDQSSLTAIFWIMAALGIIPLFIWSLCFISDWHKHLGHCNNMFNY